MGQDKIKQLTEDKIKQLTEELERYEGMKKTLNGLIEDTGNELDGEWANAFNREARENDSVHD